MKLNYAIILFGDMKIEGWVDEWLCRDNFTTNVRIEGTWYKTGSNNVLLMYKEKEE